MSDVITSNHTIVKNTLVLYIRMIVVLVLNLYISRVILASLGVDDFGIYNVVGSVVVMFSYMNSALSLATTRFFSYEMHNGYERLKTVYNTSLLIQVVFSLIIVVIAETLGLWLVNSKLVIPVDRIVAANWVYQFSIITTVVSILSVSYNSAITSHEKMTVFAVLSIVEVFLKLVLALLINHSPIDNLVFYGLGILLITVIIYILRLLYCNHNFPETTIEKSFSKPLFKQMFSFIGWNFFGATAGMSVGQGINFIINIFFGPAVNAARAIAFQVEGAVSQFVTSINTAVNPQIVKRYSVGDKDGMNNLVFFAAKISFLLLLVICMPIIVDTTYILQLWLKDVPEYTCMFVRLIIIYLLTLSLTYAINMSAQASGKIKYFQIAEGSIILLNIPVVILLFKLGYSASTSFLSMIFFSVLSFVVKLMILSRIISFPVRQFIKEVMTKFLLISAISVIVFVLLKDIQVQTFMQFCIKTISYWVPFCIAIWLFGLKGNERTIIIGYIKMKLFHK